MRQEITALEERTQAAEQLAADRLAADEKSTRSLHEARATTTRAIEASRCPGARLQVCYGSSLWIASR